MSACMLIFHKGHTANIQVYSVTVMTHDKALQAGHSSQGTSEPITPGWQYDDLRWYHWGTSWTILMVILRYSTMSWPPGGIVCAKIIF